MPGKTSPSLPRARRRIEKTFYLLGGVFLLLGGRVLWMQTGARASTLALSDDTFLRDEALPARRGPILSRDGTALAVSIDEYIVAANPRAYTREEKDRLATLLGRTIGGDSSAYRALLEKTTRADGSPNRYVRLARRVSEERVDALRALMGPQKGENRKQRAARKEFWANLTLEATPRRHYPLGAVAPQLVGFTTNAGQGVDGMEAAWDKTLGGRDGVRESLVDAQGRAVPGTVKVWKEPTNGQTIVTTIDPKIQAEADRVMTETWKKFRPNFCVAVVMKPQTGEIVAVSTAPGFDLNNRPGDMVELATNRAFSYAYEPGSTWKIVTAAAAVENVPGWESKRFFINGIMPAGSHMIRDWQYWSGKVKPGNRSLSDGMRDSSNCVMWHFTRLMPRETLWNYAKKFGIGERTELPGFNVHPGYLPGRHPKEWPQVQLANFSFGQGMMVTPLQLAQIGAVVANDGVLMKPMLVKEVRDARGRIVQQHKPAVLRRVIKSETAREVGKMLRRVVHEGTASKFIFVPGYPAAGKTGSAQKADGKNGYRGRKFISSFVGYLPYNAETGKARYVVAIMADEPKSSHWGSETCGPAFTQIAEEAMVSMRLEEGSSAPKPNLALMERKEN